MINQYPKSPRQIAIMLDFALAGTCICLAESSDETITALFEGLPERYESQGFGKDEYESVINSLEIAIRLMHEGRKSHKDACRCVDTECDQDISGEGV